MKVYIDNIRQNAPDHSRLTPYLVYADLRDAYNGDLVISATLEYICNAIQERRWELVPEWKET